MGIVDNNAVLSDAQAITASAASTEYYDQLAKGTAVGQQLWAVFATGTAAFNTLTDLTISVQCHEDTGFSTGTKTLATSGAIVLASLTANKMLWAVPIPPTVERYIRFYYTVNGSNPSTGAITGYLTAQPNVGEVTD
jgi:hypothetical protein